MLNKLSIKSKLFLSMVLPIFGMIYFATININERHQKVEASKNIYNIAMLNIKISDLVHEFQKERGKSSGFLSSQGENFSYELEEQKRLTDEKINLLNQHLLFFNSKNKNDDFNVFKQNITKKFKELSIIRAQTMSLSLGTEEVIQLYTSINNFLLDFIYATSKNINNSDISGTILSYSNFLFVKEKTGMERALVTKMLMDNSRYYENRLKLSNLIVLQKNFLNHFFKLYKNSKIKEFHQHIHDEELVNEIKRIENILLSSAGKYDIEPSYWFEKITEKIEKQNAIANKLSKQLIVFSMEQKKKAQNDMITYNIVTVFILFIAIFLFLVIVRNIDISINKILKCILNISKNKIIKFERIKVNTQDEFGTIADTFNNMAENLIIREKENIIKNKKLQEAEKKATLSTKAKSEFLANMSHEIRTPLNAVLGFIDLLKEENIGKKYADYIEVVDSSRKSLLKIIEDILDFSKIENGKIDIDKVDFNTKIEFEVITHLFEVKCIEKNISLSLIIDKNIPQVLNTDPLIIKQIISNLLSNAIKFTDSGKRIIIKIDYMDDMLNVSVKDEGKGIAHDKLEHIFKSFTQEDSSTTRQYGGTGLGLSISSELVKFLGGELKVKSQLEVGSEFYFTIPANIGKELEYQVEVSKEMDFDGKKILLVEDNKANQMFMQVILKKLKLEYDLVNDGIEAIEAFKGNKYDAILMDENMPNLNGIEAMKRILKIEKENSLVHTPIIALTANSLKGDRERFLESGMDEFLSKPIKKDKLGEILKKFLGTA